MSHNILYCMPLSSYGGQLTIMRPEVVRLRKRLAELAAWRDREFVDLSGDFWTADSSAAHPIRPGQAWPSRTSSVRMRLAAVVPPHWSGKPVYARLSVGGEALLLVDGKARGGLNPYHREHALLEHAQGGEQVEVEVQAVPHGLFGESMPAPHLEEARLVLPDSDVRALYHDLAAALDAAAHVDDEVAVLLTDAISQTMAELKLPRSPADDYLARMALTGESVDMTATVWEEWSFADQPLLSLPDAVRAQLQPTSERLHARLAAIIERYPPVGALRVLGHAHIDLAWLWPLAETRRKARRTFATVLALMNQYPDFTFCQSMAQLYALVEADDPTLFAHIQAQVREGRWEPIGGTWVEPDGNLLSGESWVRQLWYGQSYLESRFGRRARVAWLPDTFGFTGNLPQLLNAAGLDFFLTTKLNWNETNRVPHDLYLWEGIDGSRVLAHSFRNPGQGYNGSVQALDLRGTWQNFGGKRRHSSSLFTFGYGDGGGGPTAEMLERYSRLKRFPGMPQLSMGRAEDFFREIRTDELPVWVGEQYLELHRGTYTSQSSVKSLHRRLEHTLPETEAAASLASSAGLNVAPLQEYPAAALDEAWTTLLRNQFHDILPGTSIHTVNREAQQEMSAALARAEGLRAEALAALGRQVAPARRDAQAQIVVWNLSLDDRGLRLRLPRPSDGAFRLVDPHGNEAAYQVADGDLLVALNRPVPGLGYLTLDLVRGKPSPVIPGVRAEGLVLENQYLRAELSPDGNLTSLFDRVNRREALAGLGNQLWAYTDIPRDWQAWDVDASYEREGQPLPAEAPPEVVEAGPVRAGLRVRRRLGQSTIEQTYWLWDSSPRLDVETRVDWQERRTFLRALFPLNVRAHEAWFETAFGAVARPTHRNTSWDQARFEVPGLRFADLSESGYGVSLLNDGKYGHSVAGNTLGLSLLRGPIYPDPHADRGEHHFTYSLYPHAGDWRNGTLREAHDLNAPLQAVVVEAAGSAPSERRLIGVSHPALRLSCLKRAGRGDGLVLRCYEAHGSRGSATFDLDGLGTSRAQRVNLMEDPVLETSMDGGRLATEFAPYQVLSFALK